MLSIRNCYYIVVYPDGDLESFTSYNDAMAACETAACEFIGEHSRSQRPTFDEMANLAETFNLRLLRLGTRANDVSEIALPLVEFFSDYYDAAEENQIVETEREYKLYLKLKEKFENK